jgi:hypothetical protein
VQKSVAATLNALLSAIEPLDAEKPSAVICFPGAPL